MKKLSNLIYISHRGDYIPNIVIPDNWQSGISEFYKNKGKEKLEKEVEDFANVLGGLFGKIEIDLRWDDKLGLDGISLSSQSDIILNEDLNWQEHNLNTKNSIATLTILSNYYAELSKYIK